MTEVDVEVFGPEEKDFVLFVDRNGNFNGEFDRPLPDKEGQLTTSGSSNAKGAIDEETGEINWDCPCLQSALSPPCGEYFRTAFSCFVASQTEPKGSDCLDKFAAMQDCFREHPEIYMKDTEDVKNESIETDDEENPGKDQDSLIANAKEVQSISMTNSNALG